MVSEVNTGRSVSPYRQKVLREIWYLSSLHHFKLSVVHVPGVENEISDGYHVGISTPITESKFF